MTFDLDLWPLTAWTCKGFHMISTNQVWFKSDFNFSNEAIFTFSAHLTTWPQMAFDLGTWLLTAWTYEGSHIISINQLWFKSDFNFSNEAIFTFSAYFTTWLQMTFDLDIWPLTSLTNEGSHVASMTQLWLKSIKACGRESQMLILFHDRHQPSTDNSGQSDPYVSFLLRQATQEYARIWIKKRYGFE